MDHADWQVQLEAERLEQIVKALNNAAQAGVPTEDIKTLARECGVDVNYTILGDTIKERKS